MVGVASPNLVVMCAGSAVARLAPRHSCYAPLPMWPRCWLCQATAWGVGGLGRRDDRDGGGATLRVHAIGMFAGRIWRATASTGPSATDMHAARMLLARSAVACSVRPVGGADRALHRRRARRAPLVGHPRQLQVGRASLQSWRAVDGGSRSGLACSDVVSIPWSCMGVGVPR